MQIILREDVDKLGKAGDVVTVKAGYGRNYLVPRGFAVLASARNIQEMEHHKRVIAIREGKRLKTAEALKAKLEGLSINIARQVGDEDKLFGSVTNKDIATALEGEGLKIERKSIVVPTAIKTLGVHNVKVKLSRDVNAELKVWVVAK
jgi:large subunit ribosomal protein L9